MILFSNQQRTQGKSMTQQEKTKSRRTQPRILIYIPIDLFKKFKIYCIKNDISQQDLFESFVADFCSKIED